MSENKTKPTEVSPAEFIASVEPERRRTEGRILLDLFAKTTGWTPRMWGPSIIGYGEYHYKYDSGREGDFMATGFSPRKAKLSVYILPGYQDYGSILARLGKHSLGKSCLYLNKLGDIDLDVLAELITAGITDLAKKYPVKAS
ncbi:DUF1801 domain-containing protein [Hyphobacterium sp. CCMP332]|uniref:DUF1801 domain-containing protein n=1 Tax=Hyphobacterium sp. CCMP332 TaxID=2749086 RepID=UPI00164F66C3|nr:DUF1801 domain-containing protein [Hyphobacterium sp. CCMP332]QNL19262.1 DUF1801 domain-containing protein [Hyphobacterium sp. CCMP332]